MPLQKFMIIFTTSTANPQQSSNTPTIIVRQYQNGLAVSLKDSAPLSYRQNIWLSAQYTIFHGQIFDYLKHGLLRRRSTFGSLKV